MHQIPINGDNIKTDNYSQSHEYIQIVWVRVRLFSATDTDNISHPCFLLIKDIVCGFQTQPHLFISF